MKFGHFDDVNREYVISTPKTPYPWINYLGSQDFFSIISNTGGGYCFYKDARLRRITRYRYNSVPVDNGGRYYYIKDEDTIWSPGYMPVKTDLDFYECRHGLGYTKIKGIKNGVEAEVTMFVPLDYHGEVHRVKIKNTTDSVKNLTLFSFIEFCLWNAYDDMTNFQRNYSTGEVEVEDSVIYHKTEYRERRNHYSFYSVNTDIDGFDSDRESFLGLYNGFDSPEAVLKGQSNNSIANGWAPIGSHSKNITLKPGEEVSLIYIIGYVENSEEEKWDRAGVINKNKAKMMIESFTNDTQVEKALISLHEYWLDLLNKFCIKSSDDKLNRMVNIWNPYQCMVTFNMSRSASYFESGIGRGMGFRDSNQDLLGFVHQVPDRARERILDIAATEFEDGGTYHQYQPLTKKGNFEVGGGFNDDPLWLILGVSAYIKETGDFSILDEHVPFNCDLSIKGTIMEHLKKAFYHVVNNLGPNGLPLIGRADWNDCLNLNCFSNEPDESFQTYGDPDGKVAESVLIAGMFVFIGSEYAELCRRKGLQEEAEAAGKYVAEMKKTVIKNGYDGEWFIRAYDAFGNKVGSRTNDEGQIFIESQGFCVMAGIGVEEGFALKALNSVKERLDTDFGIMLQTPAYSRYYLNLGEISSYPPGYKENAGIFCHNNPWIMIAETVIGRGTRAFELYKKICPAYLEDKSDIHRTEPYVYSQMVAGKDAVKHGEAKNSWLTGTAAWNYFAITQWILGIKPEYDGLKIDPCIPEECDGFEIKRIYRKGIYNIKVKNPEHVSKGVNTMFVDGIEYHKDTLPLFYDDYEHNVEVVLGK